MSMFDSEVVILTPYRRPDFVAILGILTRTEMEDYAARTKIIRDARKARFPETPETGLPKPTKPVHRRSWTSQVARDRDRERERSTSGKARAGGNPQGRRKENLTAASIGGAALSLLNVLSEAAEGL